MQVSGIYYNAGMSKYPFFPTFSELDQLHVDISHKGCKYSIDLPSGWDTIPHDTLKKIFPRLDLDMGLYPVSQKEYFTGNYAWLVLCLFCSPSILILSTESFRT